MQRLTVDSDIPVIGSWAGFTFPGLNPTIQNSPLADLFAEVRALQPDYAQQGPIQSLQARCQQALLTETRLSLRQIQELLTFTGTDKALADVLSQALVDPCLTGTTAEDRETQRDRLGEGLEQLRSLKVLRQWNLIKAGALGAPAVQQFGQFNKVLDSYTTSHSKRLRGIGGVNDTLQVQGVVVGAGYAQPATDNTTLGHQLGSMKIYQDSAYIGYQTTFFTPFYTADNNGAETTVAASPAPTLNAIQLTSATGFQIGDRITVYGANLNPDGEKRTIIALVGGLATLDSNLSGLPLVNDRVVQSWGETGLIINGNNVLGTRSLVSGGGYAKDNTSPVFLESALTLRIVGS